MNLILRFSKKHYLKKIKQGKITKEYVAHLYSTSPADVERALKEYQAEKKPFKKRNDEIRQGNINIIISLVSTLIVLLTLFEMQAERNLAYMPNVHINSTGVKFAWDQNHQIGINPIEVSEQEKQLFDSYEYTEGLVVNSAIQNTGIGIATEVYVDWLYEENMRAFQKFFHDKVDIAMEIRNNIFAIQYNGLTIGSPISKNKRYIYGFLSSDPNQKETLTIPDQYVFLYECAYANFQHESIPHVRFMIEYNDIQGKTYSKRFTIKPSPDFVTMHPEGHGFGVVNFIVSEEKHSTLNIFIVLIAAIGGVLIVTIIYCLVDWKYRKNKALTQVKASSPTAPLESSKPETK